MEMRFRDIVISIAINRGDRIALMFMRPIRMNGISVDIRVPVQFPARDARNSHPKHGH